MVAAGARGCRSRSASCFPRAESSLCKPDDGLQKGCPEIRSCRAGEQGVTEKGEDAHLDICQAIKINRVCARDPQSVATCSPKSTMAALFPTKL